MSAPRFGLAARLTLLLIATVLAAQLFNALILVRLEADLRTERIEALAAERVVQGLRFAEIGSVSLRGLDRRRGFRIDDEPPGSGVTQPRAEALLRETLAANGYEERAHLAVMAERSRGEMLVAAVQLQDGNWLWHMVPTPVREVPWRMLGLQTLVLTIGLLVPSLWIGRRVALPLRRVTAAADGFLTGAPSEPLPRGGPPDIDALCRAFEAMEQRILSALEERSVMLGAVGHDLRTPLASLRIRVEAVEDETLRSEMIASMEDLAAALDDILILSKEAARPNLEWVRSAALLDRLASAYVHADVAVIEGPSVRLCCAPESVIRALRNLTDNALRYGGGATVRAREEGASVVFSVEDEGPGLPDDEIERMQRPFERAEGSRNRTSGGAGLGLAIVAAVAKAHGGELRLANRSGGGLEARLILPKEQQV